MFKITSAYPDTPKPVAAATIMNISVWTNIYCMWIVHIVRINIVLVVIIKIIIIIRPMMIIVVAVWTWARKRTRFIWMAEDLDQSYIAYLKLPCCHPLCRCEHLTIIFRIHFLIVSRLASFVRISFSTLCPLISQLILKPTNIKLKPQPNETSIKFHVEKHSLVSSFLRTWRRFPR